MKLVANNPTEKRLLDYLEANACDALPEKIAALPDGPRFNLGAAWHYIESEAKKYLHSRSGYVDDLMVFGWLVDYYEDAAPAEAAKPAPEKKPAPKPEKKPAPKPEKKPAEKPSGFSFEFFGEKGGAE